MGSLCVITARGGSKRVPRKNIKEFCGKPIIAYSIEAALESKLFDEVMVSTDDEEIARIAKLYGASVPFFRSKENSDDFADTTDVLIEVFTKYKELGRFFEVFCCIYPTAPFVTSQKLNASYKLLDSFDAVVPITAFSFPPQRGFLLKNNSIEIADPDSFQKRSQDLEVIYHDCGQFYWGKTRVLLHTKNLIPENTAAYIVPEAEVQDIDNISDWELAEMKYERMKNKNES